MRHVLLLSVVLLAGCVSTGDYSAYLSAQRDMAAAQKPLVRIVAQPGQAISGLQSVEVFGPAPVIEQARPNDWAAVVSQGLGVVGTLGGIHLGGKAAIGLGGTIRDAGAASQPVVVRPEVVQPQVVRPELLLK